MSPCLVVGFGARLVKSRVDVFYACAQILSVTGGRVIRRCSLM